MATDEGVFEATFREMFRRHAAGVAIITANLNGVPFGFTATSVASLSAKPPRSRSTWPGPPAPGRPWRTRPTSASTCSGWKTRSSPTLRRAGNRFDGDHWELGPHEVPVLKGVTGWLIGKVQMRLSFENNAVVVVEVVEGQVGDDGVPLLYHSGAYSQPVPLDYEI